MPWLFNQQAPSQALLQGAQAGGIIAQTSLSKQRLAMEQRQADQDEALAPLKALMLQQKAQENEATLQAMLHQKQDEVDAKKAFAEASASISVKLKDANPNYDSILSDLLDAGAKHPAFGASPDFKNLAGMVDFSAGLKNKAELAKERADSAEKIAALRAQVAKDKVPEFQAKTDAILKAEAEVNSTSDPVLKSFAQRKLDTLRDVALPAGQTTEVTTPEGYSVKTTIGGHGGGAGSSAKAVEDTSSALSTVQLGGALLKAVNPDTVGVRGFVNREVLAPAAQIFPNLYSTPVSQAIQGGTLISEFRMMAVKNFRPGGYLNKQELNIVLDRLPSEGMRISVPQAKDQIQVARRSIADAQRKKMAVEGKPVPYELMRPTELKAAVRAGQLDRAKAAAYAENSPYIDPNAKSLVEVP